MDVLHLRENQFEGESFNPKLIEKTEVNFYRGATPEWLNFHISEQAESGGIGTPLIKRDGHDALVGQIHQRRKRPGISTVKLFHQPGCGGTTLAMQVLWDLRKTFRCAVLTESSKDITNVAKEVVNLFTDGDQDNQSTVLLLLNDEHILENLQEGIMMKISEQGIVPRTTVVILFSCVRKDEVQQTDHVILQKVLSDTEMQKFNEKGKELSKRYGDRYQQFHGFNIMRTNFCEAYIEQACAEFSTVKKANRPLKTQLAAFLSLLNAYVPGSYLLESQCLDFLKHKDPIHGELLLEDRLKPFSHLIITFQQDIRSEKKVCMAHPMIAQCCTRLMAAAGVTRSDTTRNFLNRLCKGEVPPFLHDFVKEMLTRREIKKGNTINSTEIKEEQELFSKLILDITNEEGNNESASVLKVASRRLNENPFFPQALARFYYIELKNYNWARMWAKTAKQRDPTNSFVADTLGQVHKNHLKSKEWHPNKGGQKNKTSPTTPREILQLATKAIKAFKDEEQLAENEGDTDMKEHGKTKVSHIFNTRGQFGYLQVCNLVYNLLVSQNETWRRVLTNNESMGSVLESLGDKKLYTFKDLIKRDEVERKCAFFDSYLTYSKPDMKKDDPPYISKDVSECYRTYLGNSTLNHFKQNGADFIQKPKQNPVGTSAGALSCLHREHTESELKEITTCWEKSGLCKHSGTALATYIFAHIMLMNMGEIKQPNGKALAAFREKMPLNREDAPELHMLSLLLSWPTDSEDKCAFDLSQLIECMRCSYEYAYKTDFRSRHLRPLFFIGQGQDLNRIIYRKVLERMFHEQNKGTMQERTNYWSSEKIFHDPMVQARLLKFEGVVRNYRVYATTGGKEIEVDAHLRNSLWKRRQVSFYIGFNIRGPVAFGIQTKTAENGKKGNIV